AGASGRNSTAWRARYRSKRSAHRALFAARRSAEITRRYSLPSLTRRLLAMPHVLPIRWILAAVLSIFGLAVLATVYAGRAGEGAAQEVATILRWSSAVATG